MVPIAYVLGHSFNVNIQPPSDVIYPVLGKSFHLLPYFACVSSEGYGETAHMHSLAIGFTAELYKKFQTPTSWLMFCFQIVTNKENKGNRQCSVFHFAVHKNFTKTIEQLDKVPHKASLFAMTMN